MHRHTLQEADPLPPLCSVQDCPFLDVDSPVTSYEVFKMVLGLPWLAIKAVIAVIILMMVWGVTRILIVGLPINQPMPFWRAAIVRPFLQ